MKTSSFENFPYWIVATCSAVGLAIYAIGLYLMARMGIVWGMLYGVYCLWMECRLLTGSCRRCYYFGKRCGFGKGVVCSWLFTRQAEQSRCSKRISWRDVIPDFLVSLIPLAVGILTLLRDFSWLALLMILVLLFLASVGTGFVRGQLACKYCKQRELGCPAEQLFSKTVSALGLATALAFTAYPADAAEQLRVPAFTAYVDPDPEALRVSSRSGISGWTGSVQKICWFGEIRTPGKIECAVAMRLPKGSTSNLRLTVAGQSSKAAVQGADTNSITVPFGAFEIGRTGYQRFTLESENPPGHPCGNIEALLLSGPASGNARFNLQPRRNAASVHLFYPTPGQTNIDAFYCEVTAVEDPIWTFYMACGWHRGYFGMQVNSPTERRIIFSVWDSGNEAVDRDKVTTENRVRLVAKGDGVYAGDFGNEGTGGHSHLKFMWKTGEKQRFYMTAKPGAPGHVIFAGYYFHPDKREWMLISSWDAPKEHGYLRGLHSFSENFGGANGHLPRKARYGNQWFHTAGGEWVELTTASFSHDPTGRADRLDRFMGVEHGEFFLSHGGFVDGFTRYGEKFTRQALGKAPVLPPMDSDKH